jgi:hypothetical protein
MFIDLPWLRVTASSPKGVLAGLAIMFKVGLDIAYQVAKYIDLKDNKLTYFLKKKIIDNSLNPRLIGA